jgi:hypothetical protein
MGLLQIGASITFLRFLAAVRLSGSYHPYMGDRIPTRWMARAPKYHRTFDHFGTGNTH